MYTLYSIIVLPCIQKSQEYVDLDIDQERKSSGKQAWRSVYAEEVGGRAKTGLGDGTDGASSLIESVIGWQ